MSLLVTGGAGFIGSNFILDWIAQSNDPVINLDKITYAGNIENLQSLNGDRRHVTGVGYSVLDVVKAFENASGLRVPHRISPRRLGDVATCYAKPALAEQFLGSKPERNLAAMCKDHWCWQKQNPQGYV